jgi:putative hemolysin
MKSMRHLIVSVGISLLVTVFLGACGAAAPQAQPSSAQETEPQATSTSAPASAIANPASQNCVAQDGTLEIRTRSDGSQYGVCYFEDNRQCEEWALLRGDCPVGGIKITGYVTEAAQYCAITGGQYTITGSGNTEQEQGTCTFKTGQTCDAWEYFASTCSPAATGQSTYDPESIVHSMVQQGIVSADAPGEFQKNAVWRCMDGRVWVCHFGANLPCQEKANTSQVPTAAMQEFCTANPESESIPAAVTGRATVHEWKCAGGQPQVVRQVLEVDPRGFLADFWYELPPQ